MVEQNYHQIVFYVVVKNHIYKRTRAKRNTQ